MLGDAYLICSLEARDASGFGGRHEMRSGKGLTAWLGPNGLRYRRHAGLCLGGHLGR
jgi:hypothetical protein